MLNVMISAGEASGDGHGAKVLDALRHDAISFKSFGMGADKLAAAGMEQLIDSSDLAVMGVVDVLRHYPEFRKRSKVLKAIMEKRLPDLVLLIDFAEFNLDLARHARSLGIPVLFYISPKLWASRPERIEKIAQCVTHMAVIFPFEVELLKKAGIDATYVGNPNIENLDVDDNLQQARQTLGLEGSGKTSESRKFVGLLPGSRKAEINYILPLQLQAAQQLLLLHPQLEFVLPRASTIEKSLLNKLLQQYPDIPLRVIDNQSHRVMQACDTLIVASGTATLEAALVGTPMVVVYAVNGFNYWWIKRKLTIEHVSLVNIVAGKGIALELLQSDATGDAIATETSRLLFDQEYAENQRHELALLQKNMLGDSPGGKSASDGVASLITSMTASVATSG